MKQTVTRHDFADALADDFSRSAASALFDWYEELEAGTGEELELDPIAIRCDWSEYETATEAFADLELGHPGADEGDEDRDPDEHEGECLRFFERTTTVLQFDGGILILAY